MSPVISAPRRDPAPSRIAYRLHRMWLTPQVRLTMRVVLPFLVAFGSVTWWFNQPGNREMVLAKAAEMRRTIEERPEFMVRLMSIDGASETVAEDIREIVPVDFPVSSFDLDLAGMRDRIAELDAVADVEVRVAAGGVLAVAVTERTPVAVWRNRGELDLVDGEGHRVATIADRRSRAELPLIAGEGAERAVPEALSIYAAAGPIADRIRGLVRVGERRWDVVLDRDQRILLPEERALFAFEQVMALVVAQDLMERDIELVDMRNIARPTVRLAPGAADQIHTIRETKSGAKRR